MTESDQNSDKQVFIQPRKLANKNGELRYQWPIGDFKRLDGLLFSNEGHISVHIKGRNNNRQRSLLDVHITATIKLECQTSFEAIDYQVDTQIVYCMVMTEEQITDLDERYEALLVDDGFVDIKQVIEDEFILSLPVVANKAMEDVDIKTSYGELPKEATTKKNPFEVLQGLNVKD